jgi:hypothetical protein
MCAHRVRLIGISAALFFLLAPCACGTVTKWRDVDHVSYAQWRARDTQRIELLQYAAAGCARKAQRYHERGLIGQKMATVWERRATLARLATKVLAASPARPSPKCDRILRRIRWRLDQGYICAVGYATNLQLHVYIKSSTARRATFRRRIRRIGFHCRPTAAQEHRLPSALQRALRCATGATNESKVSDTSN